jgi:3-hydroxybutyryl-CoA dehydrogenase
MMSVDRAVVVGAGIMGNGIAQVVAGAGIEVSLVDVQEEALERAKASIEKSLARTVERGRLEKDEAEGTLGRLEFTTDLDAAAAGADHAIETVFEDFAVKSEVLGRLDQVCAPNVVIASNTSQFSISALAGATSRPDRVIGSHWFNPPPLMDLIELVRGVRTSEETLATALALAERYGKTTIVCSKDTPGFITSRLMVTLAIEAARIVDEGIATVEDVNTACTKAFNHAMGPLDTVDFSGLDTTLAVADNMRSRYGERFLAPQNLRTLVDAGALGRKTGSGFSDYEGEI